MTFLGRNFKEILEKFRRNFEFYFGEMWMSKHFDKPLEKILRKFWKSFEEIFKKLWKISITKLSNQFQSIVPEFYYWKIFMKFCKNGKFSGNRFRISIRIVGQSWINSEKILEKL